MYSMASHYLTGVDAKVERARLKKVMGGQVDNLLLKERLFSLYELHLRGHVEEALSRRRIKLPEEMIQRGVRDIVKALNEGTFRAFRIRGNYIKVK